MRIRKTRLVLLTFNLIFPVLFQANKKSSALIARKSFVDDFDREYKTSTQRELVFVYGKGPSGVFSVREYCCRSVEGGVIQARRYLLQMEK